MNDNEYTQKEQLSEGVYVFENGNRSWGGGVNHNFELLNEALKKKTLRVTSNGRELGTYDGKSDTEINIEIKSITNNDIDNMFVDGEE